MDNVWGTPAAGKIALGDLDGDGDLDPFVSNVAPSPNNKIWLNDGLGRFLDSGQSLGDADGYGIALGDLDGDGDLDVWINNELEPNKVWFNDHPCFVLCGDCDGDGDIDILDALRVAQMAVGLFIPTPQDFLACDVDNDGDIDIIDSLLIARVAAGIPLVLTCP